MKKSSRAFALATAGLIIVAIILFHMSSSVTGIQQYLTYKYSDVNHLTAQEVASISPADLLIFDVREAVEYEVSHMAGAIWVSPDTEPDVFLEKYQGDMSNKSVVFYCSVGRRSSEFVHNIQKEDQQFSLYNLEGGLFHWVNEDRPIYGKGIHPYSRYWSRLIKDKQLINYTPGDSAHEES